MFAFLALDLPVNPGQLVPAHAIHANKSHQKCDSVILPILAGIAIAGTFNTHAIVGYEYKPTTMSVVKCSDCWRFCQYTNLNRNTAGSNRFLAAADLDNQRALDLLAPQIGGTSFSYKTVATMPMSQE